MKSRKLAALASAALISMVAVTGCSADSQPSTGEELTEISFRLDWSWGAEHLGYLVADSLGYYAEEGLDVTISEGTGSAVTATALAGGEAQLGVISAGEVLAAVSKDLPIISVATVVQSNPSAIVYDKDRLEITQLSDLYGLQLGTVPESSIYKEWSAVAALNELDRSKFTEVAVGQALVQALVTGQVDAITAWTFNQGLQAQSQGANVGFLTFASLGLDVPNSTVAASKSFAEANPEAMKAFLRATARGWEYTKANPEEALKLLFEAQPKIEVEYNTMKLPLVLELMGDTFGEFDETTWTSLRSLYADQGMLGRNVELQGDAYTSEYLPTQ